MGLNNERKEVRIWRVLQYITDSGRGAEDSKVHLQRTIYKGQVGIKGSLG